MHSALALADFDKVQANAFAQLIAFAFDLFGQRELNLDNLVVFTADLRIDSTGPAVDARDFSNQYFVLLAFHLIKNGYALRFAHRLDNHLFGGLCGDSSHGICVDFHTHHVAFSGV